MANGGKILADYANDNPPNVARTPLFANIMKKSQGKVVPFVYPSNANYWSATEGNSYYAWYASGYSGFFNYGGMCVSLGCAPVSLYTLRSNA